MNICYVCFKHTHCNSEVKFCECDCIKPKRQRREVIAPSIKWAEFEYKIPKLIARAN